MAFRVRDLVINVVPREGGALTPACACPQATCFECTQDLTICRPCSAQPTLCGRCSLLQPSLCGVCSLSDPTIVCQRCTFADPTICPGHSVVCGIRSICPGGTQCPGGTIACDISRIEQLPVDPESLAALKSQLRQALADVEAHEEALNERMAPQTVEDAEALEEKLSEALEEVRARKEALRKKGKEGA